MTPATPRTSPLRRLACALLLGAAAGLAQAAIAPQQKAPDFTLRSMDGRNMRLAELRGRVVLVNFWATWCGPCRQEMPQLSKLYDRYRGAGLVLLGVNVDDDVRRAADVAGKLAVTFPVLLDTDKQVSKLYELNSMPSTLIIDRDGRIRFIHLGYRDGYEAAYERQIRDLLKE
jgi:peroxiredoxin